MTCYSVQTRDRIFVKDYRFLSFVKNIGRNIGKNLGKDLSCKHSQKLIHHAKQSAIDAFKITSKKQQKQMVIYLETKLPIKLQEPQKTSLKNNSETNEEEILRGKFIPPELRHKNINGVS